MTAINDLHEAMIRAQEELGLIFDQPIIGGQLRRCPVEGGRRGAQDGAYRIYFDPPAKLWAMNHRTGQKRVFPFGGSPSAWSPAERQAFAAKVKMNRTAKEDAQRVAWAVAAQKAEHIYAAARPCAGHPYLAAKGVKPVSALRVSGKYLIAPLYDDYGDLRTLQFIDKPDQKRFLKGGRKADCYLRLFDESTNQSHALIVAEGLATALSIFESTGLEVLVAFDVWNLTSVALGARRAWPGREMILAADNDCGKAINTGVVKAKEAAIAVGGPLRNCVKITYIYYDGEII